MAKTNKCLKIFVLILGCIMLTCAYVGSISAKTVTMTAQPFSGIQPLEVKFSCAVASNTQPPQSYKMDFGDGSPEETIETTQYSCSFSHTYQSGGLFQPVCTATKELGITSTSDPAKIIIAKWRFETNGEIDSSPSIGPDGTVYIGSDDGNLYAIDPETGIEKWHYLTGAEIRSSPAIGSNGTIYFGSLDKNFYALKPNGSVKWLYNTGDFNLSSPAINSAGNVVCFGSSNNNIYAINASSGTLKWQIATGGKIVSSPAIGNDGLEDVVYVGSLDHNIYALAANNGTIKWTYKTNTEVYGSPAIGSDGRIYIGEVQTGDALDYNYELFCLNVDGTKLWEFDGGAGFYSSPAIGPDGLIYIGSWDGTFYALNPNLTKNWSITTSPPREINSSPAVGFAGDNPVIYLGCKDGNFYAFQSPTVTNTENETTHNWVYKTGDDIWYSSPAIDNNGTIYIGSHDKCLYAINPGNMNLAHSPWPMFHNQPDHSGYSKSIQIPAVISTSPSTNANDVEADLTTIQINFSPEIKTPQVLIDSFEIKKGTSIIKGQAILKSKKYNNTGFNVSAIFTPNNDELPFEYGTTCRASIKYYPVTQSEVNASEIGSEAITYSWSFTTEAKPEEETNPHPHADWSCFIDSIIP